MRGDNTIEITQAFKEIESISKTATRVPGLRNRAIIDLDHLTRIVDELQTSIPADIQEAREIIKQKDSVLTQAQLESRRIKEDAQKEARELAAASQEEHQTKVSESEIVRSAEAKAEDINQQSLQESQQIIQDAQRRSYRILDESESESKSRREGADQYAKETLFELEERLSNLLGQTRKGIDILGLETDVGILNGNGMQPIPAPVQEPSGTS